MILAIDVGNTNITIAVLRDGEVEASLRPGGLNRGRLRT